ncbi:MAG: putative regulatory protein [Jatrophihabitans sp.]|nr:putative regulatory protein [Jatrophihabitans sp.]
MLPYGRDALLVELRDVAEVVPLQLSALALPGVLEAVPGARTVLVEFDPTLTGATALTAGLLSAPLAAKTAAPTRQVALEVVYDGADLAAVSTATGLSPEDVIALHSGAVYTVRFCGFAPGFAYLDGLDPRLHVPRHASPRATVPAGAVAVAGEFAGVYPRSSPGGWQLLGHTDAVLWDATATPPALLTPGTAVRFVVA